MRILLCALALFTALSWPGYVRAQEPGRQILFVGELMTLTMRRQDYSLPPQREDGPIVISNSCGTIEATFKVMRSTAPLPSAVTVSLSMGEWCVQHFLFEVGYWLVILDAESGRHIGSYMLFDDGARIYAFQENNERQLRRYASDVRGMLVSQPLPEPVRYPYSIGTPREDFVENQPDLELNDDWILVTRGVPIDAIFPGFTLDD